MKRIVIAVFLALILSLSAVTPAFADMYTRYGQSMELASLRVEGVERSLSSASGPHSPLSMKRGETIEIQVGIYSKSRNLDSVVLEAKITGPDETIREETEAFSVPFRTTRYETLELEIPGDLDLEDNYQLNIEARSPKERVYVTMPVSVSGERHKLIIDDVLLNPGQTVKAGQPLFLTVRVENIGGSVEDDAKVTIKIPELGIIQSAFLEDLVTERLDEQRVTDETDIDVVALPALIIPSNAARGDYTLTVEVDYNDG